MGDLSWVGYDLSAFGASIRTWSERTAGMVEGLAPSRAEEPAANVDWSISEVLAHLVAAADVNLGYLGGSAEWWYDLSDLQGSGRRSVQQIEQRDPKTLAAMLRKRFLEVASHGDDDDPLRLIPWHSGLQIPLGAILGVVLGELLMHGADIAAALRYPWVIDSASAALCVRGTYAFAPLVVDRDAARARPVSYDLRIKTLPATTWTFDDAGLAIAPAVPGSRADCHLTTDPATFLLVSYGRRSALNRALRGKALAWGRKPLAGLRMASYLTPG